MVVRFRTTIPRTPSNKPSKLLRSAGPPETLNYVVDIVGGGPAAGGATTASNITSRGIIFPTYIACWDETESRGTRALGPSGRRVRISDIEIKEEIADDHTSNEKE